MVEFTQAESRLLKDATIQLRFPPAERPASAASSPGLGHGWWDWAPLGTWLFWSIIAIAAVVLLAVLVQAVRNRRGSRRAAGATIMPEEPGAFPTTAATAAILADADVLAARGEYASAVHMLLLRGVAAIQRGFPRTLVPSHTSREISVLPTLPAKVREAFAVIARRTEHAVFQQRPLGQADWEVCRATYAGLLSAAGGGGLS